MKRIILITHDSLADAYLDTLGNFIADTSFISCFHIDSSTSLDVLHEQMQASLNGEDTFIVLSELSLASSTRVAVNTAKDKSNVHVITGLNMMLLLQFALQPLEVDMDAYISRITADAQADIKYWHSPKGGL